VVISVSNAGGTIEIIDLNDDVEVDVEYIEQDEDSSNED